MDVASLELCKELYELSGWGDVDNGYVPEYEPDEPPVVLIPEGKLAYTHDGQDYYYVAKESDIYQVIYTPAYDLGYLLRKLPEIRLETWHDGHVVIKHFTANGVAEKLERLGKIVKVETDTPEDAAAGLAIELFRQGILKKRGEDE